MKKPSVSQILDLLNKPALISWANKIGLMGQSVASFSKEKMQKGTKSHSEIEDFLLNGNCLEDDFRQKRIEELFNDCEIISVEESFESEFYKGRVDIRFKKNGYEYIADFKSKFRKPYLEHFLQLISYKMHFGCDKIAIIDIRNFELIELPLEKEEIYKQIILNLVSIFKLKEQL